MERQRRPYGACPGTHHHHHLPVVVVVSRHGGMSPLTLAFQSSALVLLPECVLLLGGGGSPRVGILVELFLRTARFGHIATAFPSLPLGMRDSVASR